MPRVLACDQGTTSCRAALVVDGRIEVVAQHAFKQHFPRPGWVEHDPAEIWRCQLQCLQEVIHAAGGDGAQIDCIGLTNQRETALVWDRASGEALGPAIVWQDRRTAARTDRLQADGYAPLIRARTGLVLDPYFSASKFAWLLDAKPGLRRRAEAGEVCLGTIDSWLLWQLSGGRVHRSDISNAARTSLLDIHHGTWDRELASIFAVPLAALPEVVDSTGELAVSEAGVLGTEIPVTGCAGDQQAALFGQGCLQPGMVKITYGTGGFIVLNTGSERRDADGVLSTIAWRLKAAPITYALEGSVFDVGSAVQWLADGLGLIETADAIEELASQVEDSADCFLVPAFSGLATPYWDPHARGLIVGLSRGHQRAHIAYACLEGISLLVADALAAMRGSGLSLHDLRVDGGASRNNLLLQLQADATGLPVQRSVQTETTLLGAAALAAVGAGLWTPQQAAGAGERTEALQPRQDDQARQARRRRWRQAVERCRGWATES